jgi:hypothetical protein
MGRIVSWCLSFLTLLVVPVGYSLLEDGRGRRKKKKYARQD